MVNRLCCQTVIVKPAGWTNRVHHALYRGRRLCTSRLAEPCDYLHKSSFWGGYFSGFDCGCRSSSTGLAQARAEGSGRLSRLRCELDLDFNNRSASSLFSVRWPVDLGVIVIRLIWLICGSIVTTHCRMVYFIKKVLTYLVFIIMFGVSREIVVILTLLF
jgi:hypothetical protein